MNRKRGWALITGASSGLGLDFATALAEQGRDLVLTARRIEPMERLAVDLRAKHGVRVRVEPADLSIEGTATALKARLDGEGVQVGTLINNAGHGLIAEFLDQSAERIAGMLRLNILGATELTHVFATDMAARGGGEILLVASVAGYQPCPIYAAYAASKAYVLSLGEALHAEFVSRHVVVTVLSPGVTDTGFFDAAGEPPTAMMKRMMMTPRSVVDIGLAALAKGQSSVVAGKANRLGTLLSRVLSRRFIARVGYKAMKT